MIQASPRYCLVPSAPLDGARRLLPTSVGLLIVDTLTPERVPSALLSRSGPLLFEAHRALEPGGTLLWACPHPHFSSLLSLALRYGFTAHAPSVAIARGPAGFEGLLCPLSRKGNGSSALQGLPALVEIGTEDDDAADRAQHATALWEAVLEAGPCDPDEGPGGGAWLVEIGAALPCLGVTALARGWSWLGVGLRPESESGPWSPALEATGARAAEVVTTILGQSATFATPQRSLGRQPIQGDGRTEVLPGLG